MSALTAGISTLSLSAGTYMTEIVRGGIQSVDKGQMEASRSLGIGYLPTMRKVILPQAIGTMILSYINQFVRTRPPARWIPRWSVTCWRCCASSHEAA